MGVLFLVMRAVHILGGIFWVGGAIVMAGFVLPTVKATAPASGAFMRHLTGPANFPKMMSIAGILSVLAGIGMFVTVSGHFDPVWMRSRHGIALSTGGLLAILALLEGLVVTRVAAEKLGSIGRQVAAAGAPPSPEQAQTMGVLQEKLARSVTRGAWMLSLAAVLMAIARYL
jgi:hypothetical protein